jgi:nucleotide-binding universal stress UspA family protein
MESRQRGNWRRAVDPLNWRIRKSEAESYLDEQARRLVEAGLKVEKQILEGNAAEQIVELSHSSEAGFILISSHGQSGLSGWNVSSVVQKIILRAHTSIMIVRAYQPVSAEITGLRYQRLLVPMDGSQRAECILPAAAALRRAHEAQIVLAHVARHPEMPHRTPLSEEDARLSDRVVERNRTEATRYLDQLRDHLGGDVQTRVLVSEQVAATLHEMVDQEKADLVLLSAHGYSSMTRWPYGSVVNSFITYGVTPLLIVQDLPMNKIEPTRAETAAGRNGK